MKNTGKISVWRIWRVGPRNMFTDTALSWSFVDSFQFTCILEELVTEIWYKIILRIYVFNYILKLYAIRYRFRVTQT